MTDWIGQAGPYLILLGFRPLRPGASPFRRDQERNQLRHRWTSGEQGAEAGRVAVAHASGTDVVGPDPSREGAPKIVVELKWCQQRHDKIHEAIWDLFKRRPDRSPVRRRRISRQRRAGRYVADGAVCRVVLNGCDRQHGPVRVPIPAWSPRVGLAPRGRLRPLPREVPTEIAVREVAPVPVTFGHSTGRYELSGCHPVLRRTTLQHGWPNGVRPAGDAPCVGVPATSPSLWLAEWRAPVGTAAS